MYTKELKYEEKSYDALVNPYNRSSQLINKSKKPIAIFRFNNLERDPDLYRGYNDITMKPYQGEKCLPEVHNCFELINKDFNKKFKIQNSNEWFDANKKELKPVFKLEAKFFSNIHEALANNKKIDDINASAKVIVNKTNNYIRAYPRAPIIIGALAYHLSLPSESEWSPHTGESLLCPGAIAIINRSLWRGDYSIFDKTNFLIYFYIY